MNCAAIQLHSIYNFEVTFVIKAVFLFFVDLNSTVEGALQHRTIHGMCICVSASAIWPGIWYTIRFLFILVLLEDFALARRLLRIYQWVSVGAAQQQNKERKKYNRNKKNHSLLQLNPPTSACSPVSLVLATQHGQFYVYICERPRFYTRQHIVFLSSVSFTQFITFCFEFM